MSSEKITRQAYELPLLKSLLELGGSSAPDDQLYRLVADKMGIIPGDMDYDIVHAREKWVYTLQWVRYNLVRQGDLDGSQRGLWTLTEQGRQRALTEPMAHVRAPIPTPEEYLSDKTQDFFTQLYEARLACLAELDLSQLLPSLATPMFKLNDMTAEQMIRRSLQVFLDASDGAVSQVVRAGAPVGESAAWLRLPPVDGVTHRLRLDYESAWRRAVNRFTKQFAELFIGADGELDWAAIYGEATPGDLGVEK